MRGHDQHPPTAADRRQKPDRALDRGRAADQVRHSIAREETDSNFGFNLPWWDRLFGI